MASIIIIIIIFIPSGVKIPGLKTKIKNKLEWLRVSTRPQLESLVKEDWTEPLSQLLSVFNFLNFMFYTPGCKDHEG